MGKSPVHEKLAGMRLPMVAAPLFLVSGPDLVAACCAAGIAGTFPAHNQRTVDGFESWVVDIQSRLAEHEERTGSAPAPFGANLIVHKSNSTLKEELAVCIKHEVPIVITSLGAVRDVVDSVHGYGGIVLHDVISLRHAEKAAEAGADGLIALTAGAGGHTGSANPFALLNEIKSFFDGAVLLAGSLSTGGDIAAAQMMGADFAYLGTRFIATREASAPDAYKEMVVASRLADIVSTDAVTGIRAAFMKASLDEAGIDLDTPGEHEPAAIDEELDEALQESNAKKPWRDVWSAGEGVGSVRDIPDVKDLVDQLADEYRIASDSFSKRSRAFMKKQGGG